MSTGFLLVVGPPGTWVEADDGRPPARPCPFRPADGFAWRTFPVSEDRDTLGWRADASLPAPRPRPFRLGATGADVFPTPGVEVFVQALAAPPSLLTARRAFRPAEGGEPAWGFLPPRPEGWAVPDLFVRPRPGYRPAATAPTDVLPPAVPDAQPWGWRVDIGLPPALPARRPRPEGAAPSPGAGALAERLPPQEATGRVPARPAARQLDREAQLSAFAVQPPPWLPPAAEGLPPPRLRPFRPADVTDAAPPAALEGQLAAAFVAQLAPLWPAERGRRPAPPWRPGEGAFALEVSLAAPAYFPLAGEGLPVRPRTFRPPAESWAVPDWPGVVSIIVLGPYTLAGGLVYCALAAAGDVQTAE